MTISRLGLSLVAGALVAAGLWGCDGNETGDGGNGGKGGSGEGGETTTSTTSSAGGAGGAGGSGGGPTGQPGYVGRACADDSACGPGGRCILPDVFDSAMFGGPAGGYCTLPCEVPEDCPDPGSDCAIKPTGEGECVLGCTWGKPAFKYGETPLDPNKCHGREDVACVQQYNDLTVCWPTCGSDSQCPTGKLCDPLLTVCVDTPPEGKQFGEECDVEAQDCAGHCMRLQGTEKQTVCTNLCALGGLFEDSLDCGGIEKGWCVARGTNNGAGIGDRGYCVPSCLTQEDCRTPDFFCVNFLPASTGLCMPAIVCESDGDCANPATECADTTLGKFCLSPEYPLGALDPTSAP